MRRRTKARETALQILYQRDITGQAIDECLDDFWATKGEFEDSVKEFARMLALETIANIVDVVRVALENTPPELAADLVDRGIVMAGGGSLLHGLDRLLSKETGLPVKVADNTLLCVVLGAGKVLDEFDFFKDALMK